MVFSAVRPISKKTRRRELSRRAPDIEILQLARELDMLAERFPRFSPRINRLTYLVRFQLRPQRIKQKLIRTALHKFDCLALDEIVDETDLDLSAVVESLAPMIRRKQVELCLRNGARYQAPAGAHTDSLGRQLNSLNRVAPIAIFFRLSKRGD